MPISADILRSLTWTKKKALFTLKKSHFKKKCLDFFSFFTVSLLLYLECAPLSLYFFFVSPRVSLFFSIPWSLQEADWADFDSELLICSANVNGGNVHNGQTRGLLRSVLDHCLAPLSCVFLCGGKKNRTAVRRPVTCCEIAEK